MKTKHRAVELPPKPPKGGASGLVSRLIDKLRPAPARLAPPGQRSGEGTDSLGPYLRQARETRPAPLE
ncbi:hypothetical protein [Ramlibacter sp.]|uniref:hypothetical protein n=1 Tax=Ramlibacter sp. TaxID=1917967 RepID=UPI002D327958|nr:hypothetical protein [Ramlibacter sp.]HYD75344.1 hypothetical protein [Ramlibacter sp.]